MHRLPLLVTVALTLAACSSPGPDSIPRGTRTDAGADVETVEPVDGAGADAVAAIDAPSETTTDSNDATADAGDGRGDAHEAGEDASDGRGDASAADAVPGLDGGSSDAIGADVGADTADARINGDAGIIADAATDAGWPCPPSEANCASVNRTVADIRRTFPQSCKVGAQKCGSLVDSASLDAGQTIVTTAPLACVGGAWTLAGSWNGANWVSWYECSHACTVNTLCDP